jgi:hypothetical protein
VLERLDQLYVIGGGPGANRIGYSPEEDLAHDLARGWMEKAGLEISVDAAGNLIGRHPGGGDVWTGSHLESVPNGGEVRRARAASSPDEFSSSEDVALAVDVLTAALRSL